jgi:hypothetical protein
MEVEGSQGLPPDDGGGDEPEAASEADIDAVIAAVRSAQVGVHRGVEDGNVYQEHNLLGVSAPKPKGTAWSRCWGSMVFKDLVGYPLWETALHNELEPVFPVLQQIFLHYRGATATGTMSIGNATKLGMMEMLDFAKDTDICTPTFKSADLERQFYIANNQEALQTTGSADRHTGGTRQVFSRRSAATAGLRPSVMTTSGAASPRGGQFSSRGGGSARGPPRKESMLQKEKVRPDMQLTLYEFVNFLVRVAFWRANPDWGEKDNKLDLTPLPECVHMLMHDVVLPNAKRDESHLFRQVMQADADTQKVLHDWRPKIELWLRPILHDIRGWERSDWRRDLQLGYDDWTNLMDGTKVANSSETVDWKASEKAKKAARCPKMVGEWQLKQESQITGDERTGPRMVMSFICKLSMVQCRFNFLHSQCLDGDVEAADGSILSLDELLECIARCAVHAYTQPMSIYLPSHRRHAMSMADAVRSWIMNLLWVKSPELCMWEATVIRAPRYDWRTLTPKLPGFTDAQHTLFCHCWEGMMLMDMHHFPLWEKGVHNCLQARFPDLMNIFTKYCKGISGVDSATDALQMELEEFHDFVKDARLETKFVSFTQFSSIFQKANASRTAEAFEHHVRETRNSQVVMEQEQQEKKEECKRLAKGRQDRREGNVGTRKIIKKDEVPSSSMTMTEFLGCLVRMAFLRANPRFGNLDAHGKVLTVELPGCLRRMLDDNVLPFSKRDESHLFRQQIATDESVQAVLREYRQRLHHYYEAMCALHFGSTKERSFGFELFLAICKGEIKWKKAGYDLKVGHSYKAVRNENPDAGQASGLGTDAIIGECSIGRESDITGDERCKQRFSIRLTMLEAKYAFLDSQSLEQMVAGDTKVSDDMATIDFTEFQECLCRLARDKYGEMPKEHMSLADGVRGIIHNILGERSDEAVLRDHTYIRAERYDWRTATPMAGESEKSFGRWLECWQCLEIADLHYFPLWEGGVFKILHECFESLVQIFAHYAKSVSDTTVEDTMEITMTEFKRLVKDVGLETRDFKWERMQTIFKKANSLHNDKVHAQRKLEKGNSEVVRAGSGSKTMAHSKQSWAGALLTRTGKAAAKKEDEMDLELVLHEFVEVLVRISFARANPKFGDFKDGNKPPTTLTPLPDCLDTMLNNVILPAAKRDDSAVFKDKLAGDAAMQAVLAAYEDKLKAWHEFHGRATRLQSAAAAKIQFQKWLDLLKQGFGAKHGVLGYTPPEQLGNWEINQDSEITGDERCRDKFKATFSMPQAKFAFINSQTLDQMSIGQQTDTDSMATLDFEEFKECVARCGAEKFKLVTKMSDAQRVAAFCKNLLGEENTEESMWSATLIKAERYNWKLLSQPLKGQPLKEHKKWLAVWQRIEITDVYYFPLWEKGVHDLLQKHFQTLSLIFLAYCRSVLGSSSAADAIEMEMAEFKDFVDECKLETKFVNFDLMTNMFIKANAVNSAQVRDAHHESRRTAGTKRDQRTTIDPGRTKGSNDGTEAVKDQELVLFEFIAVLVRIAFQRANPTFGNYGNKKAVVQLPGCLEAMLKDEVLPRARQDTSQVFRDTIMEELSVKAIIEQYREQLRVWFEHKCTDYNSSTQFAKMNMEFFLHLCEADEGASLRVVGDLQRTTSSKTVSASAISGICGRWECRRESDYTDDPRCKKQYSWSLSMHQVRMAFMNSQPAEQLQGAKSMGGDAMETLSFDEFVECLCRMGVDKYHKHVPEVAPAQAVEGSFRNILGEATPDEIVIAATYIHAVRFDAETLPLLKDESKFEHRKWLDCWSRMEIMDMYMWPLWEKEVHDILHPLFKELQLIFLAYTRSISEDSAEDAMEMSMDEFHDFVVDIGLETKQYKFDVMCNQFIKANATNTAQVRAQRQDEKRDAQSRGNDDPNWKKKEKAPKKVRGTELGGEAARDQELVLYEFLAMLVRIAFWRANPDFGLWVDKDGDGVKDLQEPVPVPLALATMLNEVVLPKAKRENSAAFRETYMKDPELLEVLGAYNMKLETWFVSNVGKDTTASGTRRLLDFESWLSVVTSQRLVGEWEVEQLSAVTGDTSTKGNIKIRLSIPTCKAAFMDSQDVAQLGVAQAHSGSAQAVLDLDEFQECLARVAMSKYSAIKQLSPARKVEAFLQNFFKEFSEAEIMREATYIPARRYDTSESRPLEAETAGEHAAFLAEFTQLQLEGLYGWPLWEKEVHDLLHTHFATLSSIFRAYCKSAGESTVASNGRDAEAFTMSLEEFKDLARDVGLETVLITNKAATPATYTLQDMEEEFLTANKSGKGLAGPQADGELLLHEFLNVLTRVSFHRLNPEYGELTMEHQDTLLPVPQCLEQTLRECLLPKAHRDDAGTFRETTLARRDVQAVLTAAAMKLETWYRNLPRDRNRKVNVTCWLAELQLRKALGTWTVEQGSDIVGDDRVGTLFSCRLSEVQAKLAFTYAQRDADGKLLPHDINRGKEIEDVSLDLEELQEALARCAVFKYQSVPQMDMGAKVAAMIKNVIGEQTEEQAVREATYIRAERFVPPSLEVTVHAGLRRWLQVWKHVKVSTLAGFPLWEKDVFDMLFAQQDALGSIFRAYSASSLSGSNDGMEMVEFHDFVIETDLITDQYGFDTMKGQFHKANAGSDDNFLELHEFCTMLVRISFFRANPQYGMRKGKDQKNAHKFDEVPLPGCLNALLVENVLKLARRDTDGKRFANEVFNTTGVQAALQEDSKRLSDSYEMLSAGRDFLTLEQWLGALSERLILSDLMIKTPAGREVKVRLTEPQARWAFLSAAKEPTKGLAPSEFAACVAHTACEKYKHAGLDDSCKVRALLLNFLDNQDEEDVLLSLNGASPSGAASAMAVLASEWAADPKLKTLYEKVQLEPSLTGITLVEVKQALKEQGGHVGKAFVELKKARAPTEDTVQQV